MKYIPLTQNRQAIVDDEDYVELSQYRWHVANGYVVRHVTTKPDVREYMHRAVNKTPKGLVTDHVNGDKLDNRRDNLRTATVSQNSANTIKRSSYGNPTKGVSWFAPRRNWRARIKKETIGYYQTIEEAREAYQARAVELYGEYAKFESL